MSKRVIWSLILVTLAITTALIARNMIGGLVSTFFLLMMLLVWAIPSNPSGSKQTNQGPGWKGLSLAFLGIGLGLFASITAALVLPPQLLPLVIMAVGIGIVVWFIMSRR